jgi:hypothetical protein
MPIQIREKIEYALIRGQPLRDIAIQSGVSKDSLLRHKEGHIPEALSKAQRLKIELSADNILSQILELQEKTLAILKNAEETGDPRTALSAIREARGNVELLVKTNYVLNERPKTEAELEPRYVFINLLTAKEDGSTMDKRITLINRFISGRLNNGMTTDLCQMNQQAKEDLVYAIFSPVDTKTSSPE